MRATWYFPETMGTPAFWGRQLRHPAVHLTGFSFTLSAQVNESTASYPQAARSPMSFPARQFHHLLPQVDKGDAASGQRVSPEFSGVAGEGPPNEIAGHVTALGQGITGVLVQAFAGLGAAERSVYGRQRGEVLP